MTTAATAAATATATQLQPLPPPPPPAQIKEIAVPLSSVVRALSEGRKTDAPEEQPEKEEVMMRVATRRLGVVALFRTMRGEGIV
jgi:hypothetical protein